MPQGYQSFPIPLWSTFWANLQLTPIWSSPTSSVPNVALNSLPWGSYWMFHGLNGFRLRVNGQNCGQLITLMCCCKSTKCSV